VVETPNETATLHLPLSFRVRFVPDPGTTIDPASFRAMYNSLFTVDITDRLKKKANLTAQGLWADNVDCAAGHHKVTLSIADNLGREETDRLLVLHGGLTRPPSIDAILRSAAGRQARGALRSAGGGDGRARGGRACARRRACKPMRLPVPCWRRLSVRRSPRCGRCSISPAPCCTPISAGRCWPTQRSKPPRR